MKTNLTYTLCCTLALLISCSNNNSIPVEIIDIPMSTMDLYLSDDSYSCGIMLINSGDTVYYYSDPPEPLGLPDIDYANSSIKCTETIFLNGSVIPPYTNLLDAKSAFESCTYISIIHPGPYYILFPHSEFGNENLNGKTFNIHLTFIQYSNIPVLKAYAKHVIDFDTDFHLIVSN